MFLMEVLHGGYDLPKFGTGLLLFHAAVRHQIVKHLAAARILHHQIQRLLGLDHLEQFD